MDCVNGGVDFVIEAWFVGNPEAKLKAISLDGLISGLPSRRNGLFTKDLNIFLMLIKCCKREIVLVFFLSLYRETNLQYYYQNN